MGRDVYFMRLAFGRSSHDSPIQRQSTPLQDVGEGPSLQEPVASGPAENSEQPNATAEDMIPLYDVPDQQYNSRGHPSNPQSRAYGRSMRAAANDVLSVVGVVERQGADGNSNMNSQRRSEILDRENTAGGLISGFTDLSLHSATWWCEVLVMRLLAYPYVSSATFTELITQRYNEIGPVAFFFTGNVSMFAAALVNNFGSWGSHEFALYYLDRLVWAVFSSKDIRDLYTICRPYVAGFLGLCVNILQMPLCLFSCLQALELAPKGHILPPWRSLIPFSNASPLSLGNTPLVTLMYLLYGPLSKHAATFFAGTLILPTNTGLSSRRSSAQRRHSSITGRFPLKSMDNSSSSLWQRLSVGVSRSWSSFVASLWGFDSSSKTEHGLSNGGPSSTGESTNTANFHPSEATIGAHQETSGNAIPRDLPGIHLALPADDSTPIEEAIMDSTRLHIPNQDATIRISSIDSISGTINLEIGFPEDHPSFEAAQGGAASDGGGSRSRRSSGATNDRATAPSDLAAEPLNFFVNLNAIWLTQAALLPVQALLFRLVAVHFAAHPWPGRSAGAAGLRGLLGPSGAFGVYRQMGLRGYADWIGKVGLGLLCQLSIGCGFWLLECGVVRLVGRRWFGWGKIKES